MGELPWCPRFFDNCAGLFHPSLLAYHQKLDCFSFDGTLFKVNLPSAECFLSEWLLASVRLETMVSKLEIVSVKPSDSIFASANLVSNLVLLTLIVSSKTLAHSGDYSGKVRSWTLILCSIETVSSNSFIYCILILIHINCILLWHIYTIWNNTYSKLLNDDSSHFLLLDMFLPFNSTLNLPSFTILTLMFYVDFIHAGTQTHSCYLCKTIPLLFNCQGSDNHAVFNYVLHQFYPC